MKEQSVSWKIYVDSLRAADQEALKAALAAVQQENRKSEASAEKRFDLLNELRNGVATITQLEALEKVVNDLKDRINTNDGTNQGAQLTKSNIVSYLLATCGFITLIVLLANHILK